MLQVLLFKTLNLLELKMLLIYITEGSSVCGHVIQGICAAGAQLWQFNMVTHLKNWSHLEVWGVTCFFQHGKCLSLVNACWFSPITVPNHIWHSRLTICYECLFGKCWTIPIHSGFGTSNFYRFPTLKEHLSWHCFTCGWRCQTCYHHVADTTGTYILCILDGQTCLTLSCQGSSVEK